MHERSEKNINWGEAWIKKLCYPLCSHLFNKLVIITTETVMKYPVVILIEFFLWSCVDDIIQYMKSFCTKTDQNILYTRSLFIECFKSLAHLGFVKFWFNPLHALYGRAAFIIRISGFYINGLVQNMVKISRRKMFLKIIAERLSLIR